MINDFEEGRISVRLSEGTFYALQKDVSNFNFSAPDGSYNENGFFNTILPELHDNRLSDRARLRRILERRFAHKIKPEYKDEIFNELDDVFNSVQFEDKGTRYHQSKIDIRLSKDNMRKFADVFSMLKLQKISKSAYIRNLLNQYTTMRTEEREYICYKREFIELSDAASNKAVIEFPYEENLRRFYICTVDLNCYNNEFYVVGIEFENDKAILKAYRLCEFKNYRILYYDYDVDNLLLSKADKLIAEFKYHNQPLN